VTLSDELIDRYEPPTVRTSFRALLRSRSARWIAIDVSASLLRRVGHSTFRDELA
jgi:hypothetical protein